MWTKFKTFMKEEKGQALAEYGLILALIAVVTIVSLQLLGTNIDGVLGTIAAAIPA